ncbi:MAG TPA: hypothetical protein VFR41_09095 [Acidimicrobiia bacterium]|nr:hypothetical protein [Acidimicrobiia bacterium]
MGAGAALPLVRTTAARASTLTTTAVNPDGTASLSELCVSASAGKVSGPKSVPVLIAPFPLRIAQVSLVSWLDNVPASLLSYWIVTLERAAVDGIALRFAEKRTANEAVTVRVDWNFDAVTFDQSGQQLGKGDVFAVGFQPIAAPTVMRHVLITARYEPV